MSYLLMPADSRLKALAHEIEMERRHALDLSPEAEEEEGNELTTPTSSRASRVAALPPSARATPSWTRRS